MRYDIDLYDDEIDLLLEILDSNIEVFKSVPVIPIQLLHKFNSMKELRARLVALDPVSFTD